MSIDGDLDGDVFLRSLISLYIAHFDSLVIRSGKYMGKEIRDNVRKFSKLVMGVEIFEETSNAIVLQNVLDSSSFPPDKALRRMATNVSLMLQDTIRGIKESDMELLESVVQRDDEVDRYHLYVFRETNGKGGDGTAFLLIFSRILERIADHAVSASKTWRRSRTRKSSEVLENFMEETRNLFEDAIKVTYSPEFRAINEIIDRKDVIAERKQGILAGSRGSDSTIVSSVVEDFSRIGFYSTDIAELSLDTLSAAQKDLSIDW